MIWLLPTPSLSFPSASCLSFSVFLCVASSSLRMGGGNKSYDAEKAWSSIQYIIKYSLVSCVISMFPVNISILMLSREPQKKKTQARADSSAASTQQALCLRLASMYKAESWQRAVTLDNSTPQCRISEIRVWSYNPLLRSRHHRQVKLAVKT
jgi:hypothetical protein